MTKGYTLLDEITIRVGIRTNHSIFTHALNIICVLFLIAIVANNANSEWNWLEAKPQKFSQSSDYVIAVGTDENKLETVRASYIEDALKSGKEIRLKCVKVVGDIRFHDKISKNLYFLNSKFLNKVDFVKAEFQGESNFSNTEFVKKANFFAAKFLNKVDFKYAIFLGESIFNNTEFSETVDFSASEFSDNLSFFSVRFSRDVSLMVPSSINISYFGM